jgi:hypothetical protein
MQSESLIDAAAWVGRQQAFATIASHCSAAQARCLREIRETRAYERMDLSWAEFCTQHAGISRVHADALIRRLDEFGDSYFKLAELARISPETYRQIADGVHDDVIDIAGESYPITPENAPRIRTAIRALHYRLRTLETKKHRSVIELDMRQDAIFREVSERAERLLPIEDLIALRGMATGAVRKWRAISKTLEAAQPAI